MHYKPESQRHENVVKLRLNPKQLAMVQHYADYNDLPLAVAARQFFNLGSEVLFTSDDSLSIEGAQSEGPNRGRN